MIGRDDLDTIFQHPDPLDLLGDPKPLEQRQVQRKQGFADVKARVPILLDENHMPAALGEKRGDGRPGRSAANDEHVARCRPRGGCALRGTRMSGKKGQSTGALFNRPSKPGKRLPAHGADIRRAPPHSPRRGAGMNGPDNQRVVEPHPVLTGFYGQRAQRSSFVRRLFNETAPYYDGLNQLFSLGSGAWYRRRSLLRAGLRPGLKGIDLAVRAGLLAREIVGITGHARDVIGIDLSEAMLAAARRK